MKKLLLALATVVVSLSASAQNWAGGGFGLSFQSEDVVAFTLTPEIGHRFNDKWAVAGEMGYGIVSSHGNSTHKFYVGPYVRYNIFGNDRLTLFGEYAFHYQHVKSGWSGNGIEMALRPGLAVNLNDKWQLVGKFNLLEYQYTHEDNSSVLGFEITTGLTLGFVCNF